MTSQHPITPPEDLLQKLRKLGSWQEIITKAYQAGADQELEACCEWLKLEDRVDYAAMLGAARRPKPPSLKEQALLVIDTAVNDYRMSSDAASIIRRALEALSND